MDFSSLLNNRDVLAALIGGVFAFVVPRVQLSAMLSRRTGMPQQRRRSLPPFWWLALLVSCLGGFCVSGVKHVVRTGPYSIPLKRQQMPLHSEGGVVQHKSAYYGQISVGAPRSQIFNVVFDTGSGHLVLPSTMCRTPTCLNHRRYKRKASLLSQDIDVDGTHVQPGQMRDQITVTFGTGEVTGVFVQDRICLSSPSADEAVKKPEVQVGASLLQVGKIASTPNSTVLIDEDAASISEEDAARLAAAEKGQIPKAGPALDSLKAAAKLAYANQKGDGCMDLRMISAVEMSEDPFSSFKFDGVMGLGLAGLSQSSEFNFLETAAGGAWIPMPGAEKTFAVFLAIGDEEQSEITFGGWNDHHMKPGDELAWNYVKDPDLGYWQLKVYSIKANGTKLDFCDDGKCRAIVDTGTSLLAMPTVLGRNLAKSLRHDATEAGLCDGPGPQLELDLGNFTIVLDPADFSRPEVANSDLDAALQKASSSSKVPSRGACIPMMMHIDLPEPMGAKTMILGEPVMQRYYTAFDAAAHRIGFATAHHHDAHRPARVFA